MSNSAIAPPSAANRGMGQSYKTSTAIVSKLPAYGKALADRWRFHNQPKLVIVCAGGDSWSRARRWNNHSDFSALVLNPDQKPQELTWLVKDCIVLVEWGIGPGESLIIELVKALLRSEAESVSVMPMFVDHKKPAIYYDMNLPFGQRWVRVRESLVTYQKRRSNAS